jgi:hypothetical protein
VSAATQVYYATGLHLLLLRGFLDLNSGNAIVDLDVDFSGQITELLADHVNDFGSRKPSAQIVLRKEFQIGKSN